MIKKREINNSYLTGERSLFNENNLTINNTTFGEGESPLNECTDIKIYDSTFGWKYPLWYGKNIEARG